MTTLLRALSTITLARQLRLARTLALSHPADTAALQAHARRLKAELTRRGRDPFGYPHGPATKKGR